MRRTQARQCDLPLNLAAAPCLADLPCRRCGAVGVTVVALGADCRGAVEHAYCTPLCAGRSGNPWFRHLAVEAA